MTVHARIVTAADAGAAGRRRPRQRAAAVRPVDDAARRRVHRRRRCSPGSGATSSPAPGPASGAPRTCCSRRAATLSQRPSMVGDVAGAAHATRATASCGVRQHLPAPRPRAAARRAARRPSARVICPYHAWTYDLDGSLIAAPGFRDVETFDRADYGLVALPVEVWHGWVFVNATGDARRRSPSTRRARRPGRAVRAGDAGAAARGTRTRSRANWKLVAENYHECYHCPLIHPELCQVSPPTSRRQLRPAGRVGRRLDGAARRHAVTMSLAGALRRPCRSPASTRAHVLYLGLFPNLLLSPHPDYVMTHRMVPLAPDRTWIECSWYFADRDDVDPAYAVDFWDLTNRQDWAACESVQRGLARRTSARPVRAERGRRPPVGHDASLARTAAADLPQLRADRPRVNLSSATSSDRSGQGPVAEAAGVGPGTLRPDSASSARTRRRAARRWSRPPTPVVVVAASNAFEHGLLGRVDDRLEERVEVPAGERRPWPAGSAARGAQTRCQAEEDLAAAVVGGRAGTRQAEPDPARQPRRSRAGPAARRSRPRRCTTRPERRLRTGGGAEPLAHRHAATVSRSPLPEVGQQQRRRRVARGQQPRGGADAALEARGSDMPGPAPDRALVGREQRARSRRAPRPAPPPRRSRVHLHAPRVG